MKKTILSLLFVAVLASFSACTTKTTHTTSEDTYSHPAMGTTSTTTEQTTVQKY